MQIEQLPIGDLVPYARNSRVHSAAQVASVVESIRAFGFTSPVLIRDDGQIIAGHGRVMAAQKMGMAEVPCIRLGHLTDEQARAYVLADNKLSEMGTWDEELLALELKDLRDAGFELGLTGFSDDEIADLTYVESTGNTDPDEVPAVQDEAVTQPGDVWVLGDHRIMCGDSTLSAQVGLLMNGETAMLMQTDPPYGIAYVENAKSKGQPVAHADIENDDIDDVKLQAFLEATICAALPCIDPHAAFYLWHPMLTQGTFFAAAAAAADILIHRQIIWQKPSLVFGRGDYHWQHELCFYGWRRGNRPPFYGPRNQTTLWAVGRETSKDHPTAKPVDLWKPPIENHTKIGEVIYEPFSGSGSQIIAAEQTARRCYAMELSPQYVDVAVRRWQQFTGKRAVHAVTGLPFPEKVGAGETAH
jgi:DNA modification methylase